MLAQYKNSNKEVEVVQILLYHLSSNPYWLENQGTRESNNIYKKGPVIMDVEVTKSTADPPRWQRSILSRDGTFSFSPFLSFHHRHSAHR